jgi:histidinol-phosphate aminotransferase
VTFVAEIARPELAELRTYAPESRPGIRIRLDANEAPRCDCAAVREAVARAVANVALERYPDARATDLKAAIARLTGAHVDELVVGTGSDEIIALIATAFARPRPNAPQPVVLLPTPTFVMYRVTARAHGWKPIEVPLDATWDLDATAMKRAIEFAYPNVIYVASPNNPTGNRVSEAALRAVIAAAPNALVVLDEAYVDYAGPSLRSLRAEFANVAVLRTLSKVGLAALRIGWLEADPSVVREIDKVRQPFNVSATSQAAATAVLREAWADVAAHVSEVVAERERVRREMASFDAFVVAPSAANFLWVKTRRAAVEIYEELAAAGILVRSFHASGGRLANQLRVTVGSRAENDALLEALRACG